MKYIIMFKGGVETLEYFSMEMARTFEENGFKIYWFDLIFEQESAKKLKSFIEQNAIKDGKAVQLYRGVVIKISGHGDKKRFTVRKMSGTVGVERCPLTTSPFKVDSRMYSANLRLAFLALILLLGVVALCRRHLSSPCYG